MRETLRNGNRGNDVLYLQQRLNAVMNANLTADGDFGAKTFDALKSFQQKKNLTADGICGAKTWALLDEGGAVKASSSENINDAVAANAAATAQSAARYAQKIICSNEGNYSTIIKNDNGALSVGELQWHAGRALSLLRGISAKNPAQTLKILGKALYDEINNSGSSWTTRIATDTEKNVISQLLETAEGRAAQDELALNDISTYVNKGLAYGLSDPAALIYFADGTNQYGINSSLWKNIAAAALKKDGGLDAMFAATKEQTTKYLERRERVYKSVKALNLSNA